ncbi:MAG TPA: hypothetical protein PKD92_00825 [Novosphingobium sp.]|nr:hypothetical protein [Novosphingobium sp.]
MIPSIDDRLASVVRALSEVILPHLPADASLAQEQVQLCIGHLQILRAQIDAAPAFEREELADAAALAAALDKEIAGCEGERTALAAAVAGADGSDPRGQRQAIHRAIEGLVGAVSAAGEAGDQAALSRPIIDHEQARARKGRAWGAPFGFDTL